MPLSVTKQKIFSNCFRKPTHGLAVCTSCLSSICPTSPVSATHFCPHAAYSVGYFLDRCIPPAGLLYSHTNSWAHTAVGTAWCSLSWHCHLKNSSLGEVSFGLCPFLMLPHDFFWPCFLEEGEKGEKSISTPVSETRFFLSSSLFNIWWVIQSQVIQLDTNTCSLASQQEKSLIYFST